MEPDICQRGGEPVSPPRQSKIFHQPRGVFGMNATIDKKRKPSQMRRQQAIYGYLFALPWLIGLFVFTLYPILSSLYYSFTNYNFSQTTKWVGFNNYIVLFSRDYLIPISAWNTLYFAIFSVPLNTCIGILIAVMMNQKIKGIRLLRTIYYLPNVVSIVAVSMLWFFLFQGQNGIINALLSMLGIKGPNWLSDPAFAKPALILMNCWNAGGPMVIYLAGLQGIPRSYYEAADVDGASSVRKFFSITLPLLSPSILYNMIIGIIGALQTFSTALVMTDGGPVYATTFYVLALYRRAFEDMRMGYASAMAWILMIVTLTLCLIVFHVGGKKVYYEN